MLVGNGSWHDLLDILWYSLRREERRCDHHGVERGDRRFAGAYEVRRAVRRVEDMSNHLA